MANEKTIEHRITTPRFDEEKRTVFLKGYYSLIDSEIEKLEANKVTNNAKDQDHAEE